MYSGSAADQYWRTLIRIRAKQHRGQGVHKLLNIWCFYYVQTIQTVQTHTHTHTVTHTHTHTHSNTHTHRITHTHTHTQNNTHTRSLRCTDRTRGIPVHRCTSPSRCLYTLIGFWSVYNRLERPLKIHNCYYTQTHIANHTVLQNYSTTVTRQYYCSEVSDCYRSSSISSIRVLQCQQYQSTTVAVVAVVSEYYSSSTISSIRVLQQQ